MKVILFTIATKQMISLKVSHIRILKKSGNHTICLTCNKFCIASRTNNNVKTFNVKLDCFAKFSEFVSNFWQFQGKCLILISNASISFWWLYKTRIVLHWDISLRKTATLLLLYHTRFSIRTTYGIKTMIGFDFEISSLTCCEISNKREHRVPLNLYWVVIC